MARQKPRVKLTAAGRKARNELSVVRKEMKELEDLQDQLTGLYSSVSIGSIRYDKDKVQSTPQDRMLEVMPEIVEYERLISAKISSLFKHKIEMRCWIDTLQDPVQRTVLSRYFLSEKRTSLSEIADYIDYSIDQTLDIYRKALNTLGTGTQ